MIHLVLATIFNVTAYATMKQSEGFTKLTPAILTIVLYTLGVVFYALATKNLDVSVIYVVSYGLGTLMLVTIGYFFLGESMSLTKVIAMILLIGSAITLTTAA